MLTMNEIRDRLKLENLSEVGRALNKSRQQIWEIAHGINSDPRASTVEALSDYLESKEDDANK